MTQTFYRSEIEGAAHEHGLDPDLVEAIVIVESSGQTDAFRYEPGFWRRYLEGKAQWKHQNPRRVASSYGLMQVIWPTAVANGFPYTEPEHLFIPSIGLDAGCKHLAKLLEWADGDVLKAVAAYNGGQGNWMGKIPQEYAKKVNATLEAIQKARR